MVLEDRPAQPPAFPRAARRPARPVRNPRLCRDDAGNRPALGPPRPRRLPRILSQRPDPHRHRPRHAPPHAGRRECRSAIERPPPARVARTDGGTRTGGGVMARSRRRSAARKLAANVNFSYSEQARAWFQNQPREVRFVLVVRSALRALPLIEAGRRHPDFAPRIALPALRACFVTRAIAEYPLRRDRL